MLRMLCFVALLALLSACGAPPAAPSPEASATAAAAASPSAEASEPASPSAAASPSAMASESASPSAIASEEASPSVEPSEEASPSAAGAATNTGLTGTTWQWVSLSDPTQEVQVESPENYTLVFADDSTVGIKADCNSAAGTYRAGDDGALAISVGPSTLMACPPGSRGDEFVSALGAAARYTVEDGTLFIDMMADGGRLVFEPLE